MVADAGMLSEANLAALEDAELQVHRRRPDPRHPLPGEASGAGTHPGEPIADRQVFVQPTIMGTKADPRRRTIFYQYRADRARRTLKGIDTPDRESREGRRRAGGGEAEPVRPAHRRHQDASTATWRPRPAALAGLKGYVTNLPTPTAEFVLGAYHQLWQIEHSFRMSKTDLRARPIYHHKRDSIEAHLTIVLAALAVSLLARTPAPAGRSRSSSQTLRRYHTVAIQSRRPDRHRRRPAA